MIVVSDTSPLNYLIQINAIDLLPQIFDRVFVPIQVLTELRHDRTPRKVRNWAISTPNWMEARTPTKVDVIPRLHPGETEAIALAEELSAPILVDDRDAARVARERGLSILGTLAVLVEGADRNLIDFASAIEALRHTSFRIPESLVAEIIRRRLLDEPEA